MRRTALAIALLAGIGIAAAQSPATPAAETPRPRTMQDILDASTPGDWREPDPENLLYLELDSGRVVIELAPQFAPRHVANIRALARGGYFDGLSINRSQDNFVVQWGDPSEEDATRRPLPAGAEAALPAEFSIAISDALPFNHLPDPDGWAAQTGYSGSVPAARDTDEGQAWIAHCYGVVGAGRGGPPDSSNGGELYVVIGQSPRQLDRNITTVGRVLQGMDLLSVLPRGTGPLGFYAEAGQRVPISRLRLAADVPAAERVPLQVLRTDTATWDALVEARRNRRDDWYVHPAGHIDVCNIPLPVRAPPAE
jgi:peptidylprolyl isomerase